MAPLPGKWFKLEQKGKGPGARSSAAITIVGQNAYVFGGEFTPRVPVDNNLYVLDQTDLTWSIAEASGDVPPPRVGVTVAAVGDVIYVFGGRDADHNELNEFYSFDTTTNKWVLLSSGECGPVPRSYHSSAADDRRVYIFGGGCGVAGWLKDLWAYDVVDKTWAQFPSPCEGCKPRGGPGLAVAQGKIWVVSGFDGIHCFDPDDRQWAQVETSGKKPTARSMFSTAGFGKYIVIYRGEVDPSYPGNLGAGKFSGQLYALDTKTLKWKRWEGRCRSDKRPGKRGSCALALGRRFGKVGLLLYGGNSPSNDRLDDIFFFIPTGSNKNWK